MARVQYFVVKHESEWKVKLDGVHYGPFVTQAMAIRSAVDAANDSGRKGVDAQVLVQGENHQFRTEWTYGHDPYPPRG